VKERIEGSYGFEPYSAPELEARSSVTILFLERRTLIRECVTRCLREITGAEHVGSASTIAEWVGPAPSVIVLSVPGRARTRGDIEECRAASSSMVNAPPIIVLTDEEDPQHVLEALDAGAKGFIPASVTARVAFEAIRLVMAGGTYVPASLLLASRAAAAPLAADPRAPASATFTERQFAVIEMLRQGKANKLIAHELNMRESTVKVHVRNIMRKLSATNRTQVAYLYQRMIAERRVESSTNMA
jgi:DNA-binding NarL/FixJ family response regulator